MVREKIIKTKCCNLCEEEINLFTDVAVLKEQTKFLVDKFSREDIDLCSKCSIKVLNELNIPTEKLYKIIEDIKIIEEDKQKEKGFFWGGFKGEDGVVTNK